MPKPQEICVVQVGGTNYQYWKEVEVVRDLNEEVSQCSLVVAEVGDLNKGWKSLRLKPGDPAKVTLAGQMAATGAVAVRQVVYDGQNHNVKIVVQSKTADIVKGSLDLPPGQFKNQTLTQLANAALKKSGISFSLRGAIDGAEKVFERVSVHMGESPFQFILRLAQMRNIHIMDDALGNIIGIRGGGQVVAELQEGRNILSAELIWTNNEAVSNIISDTDQHGNDEHWGDKARANSAKATNSNYTGANPVTLRLVAPQPGDVKDAQMHANHMADINNATMFQANITVTGWLRDNGKLWLNEVGNLIDLYSPMLLPSERATLGIEAVTARQNDQTGTTSTLRLVLKDRLGGRDKYDTSKGDAPDQDSGPSSPEPALPLPEESQGAP
jgi:prophage tail gpP-like protein